MSIFDAKDGNTFHFCKFLCKKVKKRHEKSCPNSNPILRITPITLITEVSEVNEVNELKSRMYQLNTAPIDLFFGGHSGGTEGAGFGANIAPRNIHAISMINHWGARGAQFFSFLPI